MKPHRKWPQWKGGRREAVLKEGKQEEKTEIRRRAGLENWWQQFLWVMNPNFKCWVQITVNMYKRGQERGKTVRVYSHL